MNHTNIFLDYLHRGWSVIPLQPRSKTPARAWRAYQTRRPTERELAAWSRAYPNANLAVVTGAVSGLIVLDLDTLPAIAAARRSGLPTTPTVKTANGFHHYFAHPGIPIPNAVRLLPGMDLRGDGGYVVAPPSIHPDTGQPYTWHTHPDDAPLAPCPAWLLDLLKVESCKVEDSRQRPPSQPAFHLQHSTPSALHPPPSDLSVSSSFHPHPSSLPSSSYALAALQNEAAALARAQPGTRNHTLFTAACNLGELIAAGALDQPTVEEALERAAHTNGMIHDDGRVAFQRTLRSGLTRGLANPRDLPKTVKHENDKNESMESVSVTHPSSFLPHPSEVSVTHPSSFLPHPSIHETDLGNARRLVRRYGDAIRYVPQWNAWYTWDGARWSKDTTGEIQRLARCTVGSIYQEAANAPDFRRKELASWALKSESRLRLEAMVAVAQAEPTIPLLHTALDADPWLLNCPNGTLDLRSGALRPHSRADLLTKQSPIPYDPHAPCPTWRAFLRRIMDSDADLMAYLQRAVGYTLTGDTSEQCLFFMYGTGKNGKSTFIETLMALFGEYMQKAPTDMLMAKKPNAAIPNDIARLPGARLVVAAEIEEGRRFAESLLKDLTGGDTITARFLHQEFFEFRPTHKLWLYGNHKPIIRGSDEGIWRRIRLIPFTVTIPEPERDPHLPAKLRAELPGILAWAVEGCLAWQQQGLRTPDAVQRATAAYRADMDILAAFLDDCCHTTPAAKTTAKALYSAYQQWCEQSGEHPLTQRTFGARLTERGFHRQRGPQNRHEWLGLALLNS